MDSNINMTTNMTTNMNTTTNTTPNIPSLFMETMVSLQRQDSFYTNEKNDDKEMQQREAVLLPEMRRRLSNPEFIDKKKINMNSVKVIEKIMDKNAHLLEEVESEITKIVVRNNSIDVHDIPAIVLIIKDILNVNMNDLRTIQMTMKDLLKFIEVMLFSMIETHMIPIKNTEMYEVMIHQCVLLLESSFDLGNDETHMCKDHCCCQMRCTIA